MWHPYKGEKVEQKRNYQKELDKILDTMEKRQEGVPTLFLHSCCAPCSSYVLEYLSAFFRITVFYYNPNISLDAEYRKRVEEQKRLITALNEKGQSHPIDFVEGDYVPEDFFQAVKGLEQCPEGSERCFACFELRLSETVRRAAAAGYDFVTTTLTISPLKNAAKLNEIGERLCREAKPRWLPSDFKKKGGYQRSIELSADFQLYRQDYCGCVFSKAEREKQKQALEKCMER